MTVDVALRQFENRHERFPVRLSGSGGRPACREPRTNSFTLKLEFNPRHDLWLTLAILRDPKKMPSISGTPI